MEFNIADLFESVVDAVPDREALVCGNQRLTFAELDEKANRLAHYFEKRGIEPGGHIGLYLYNSAEFVESMLATFKIRAIPVNINYRYVKDELRYLFANADLAALVHQREFAPLIAPVAGGVPSLRLLVSVDDPSGADCSAIGSVGYEAAIAEGSPGRGFPPRSAGDLYIIYTGGTTGMPRGVMWRHGDVFYAGLQGGNPGGEPIERPEQLAEIAKSGEKALTFLPTAPFIHGAAQWAALIGLFSGGKLVLAPGRSFNPKLVWQLVQDEKVSTITLVGDAMARPLADALGEPGASYDTSSLLVMSSAGAVLSGSVKEKLQSFLPTTMLLDSFGASETGHQGTAYPTGESGGARRVRFTMDDSNTVLGDDQRPLRPGSGEVGRLARRGRLPVGYYKDPEKTAATFVEIDGERWVIPGDLATIEEDGTITVFGRGSICINSGGEKIFPEEVEDALKAHPSVEDAVVVGVPDERWGQRVAAIVQPRPGEKPILEELDAHCRKQIAGYKVPRELHVVERVLRHPSGKPDYRWAKETALSDQKGS